MRKPSRGAMPRCPEVQPRHLALVKQLPMDPNHTLPVQDCPLCLSRPRRRARESRATTTSPRALPRPASGSKSRGFLGPATDLPRLGGTRPPRPRPGLLGPPEPFPGGRPVERNDTKLKGAND